MQAELPKAIDGYPVERRIGEGAFSTVLMVRLPGRQRFAALKLLKGEVGAGEFLRLRREFTAISRCQHPNIVGVYGFGEYHSRPYYLMELIKGESIYASLRRGYGSRRYLGSSDQANLVESLCMILDALAYLHANRIIHMDLKPANILMDDSDNSVKLLDFGLAWHGRGDGSDSGFGTPGYQAPEQILTHHADPRSDLYSLGVCLYEILCGIHPFNIGQTWQELIQQQMAGRYIRLGKLFPGEGEHWEGLIDRLIAVEPSDRFQSAGQVMMELRRLFEPKRIHSTASSGTWGLLDVDFLDYAGTIEKVRALLRKAKATPIGFKAPSRAGKSNLLKQISSQMENSNTQMLLLEVDVEPDPLLQIRQLANFILRMLGENHEMQEAFNDAANAFLSPGSGTAGKSPISRRTRFFQMLENAASVMNDCVILVDDADDMAVLVRECLHTVFTAASGKCRLLLTFSETPEFENLMPVLWQPASINQIQSYIKHMLGLETISIDIARQICDLTGGNIGRVRDAFLAWLENGSLVFHDNNWFLGPPDFESETVLNLHDAVMPDCLPETLMHKIPDDRLEREVLRMLAVYGHNCPFSMLNSAFAARVELLLGMLDSLIKNGWIHEDITGGEARYRFQRRGFAERIYRSISPFHLSTLHRKIADLLEKGKEKLPNLSALLAYHFSRSDEPELSLNYLMEIAADARDRYENQLALERFKDVQEIAQTIRSVKPFSRPGPDGMVVMFTHASPRQTERLYLQCQTNIASEFELLWMTAARERGKILAGIGEYGRAFEEFQRMLTKARDIDQPLMEAQALRFIGQVLFYQQKYPEAEKNLLQAMAVFDKLQISESIGDSLNALGAIAFQQNRMHDAKGYFERAISIKKELDDNKGVAYLMNNLGNIEFAAGNFMEALGQYQESYTLLKNENDTLGRAYSCFNIGETYQAIKQFSNAITPLTEALMLRRRMDDLRGAAYCLQELGKAHQELGDTVECVQNFQDARTIFEELGRMEEVKIIDELLSKVDAVDVN